MEHKINATYVTKTLQKYYKNITNSIDFCLKM